MTSDQNRADSGAREARTGLRACPANRGRIVLDIEAIARARGVVNADGRANVMRLERLTGMSYTSLVHLLRQPERAERIYLSTLAQLCEVLGCQPGDLLRYEPPSAMPEAPLSEKYKREALAY